MRKIIFLDVDGVLNDSTYTERCAKRLKKLNLSPSLMNFERVPFNPRSLKNLQKIVLKTGAEIVLHSTWRRYEIEYGVLVARLAEYGIKVKDKTEDLLVSSKMIEISTYIAKLNAKESTPIRFAILDDTDVGLPNLVKTEFKHGLTNKKAQECIEILNKEA